MANESFNVRYSNKAYIRYANGAAYLCIPGTSPAIDECVECCPTSFTTLWEHPNVACSDDRITHSINIAKPYWHYPSGNKDGQINPVPVSAFNAICGTPPTTNLSSRIELKIPYDPIFSGSYVFEWRNGNWIYNTKLSNTSLSPYPDNNSSYYNKILVSLTETSGEPTYKGYIEAARSTTHTSNLSGVFAYPAQFVFTAMQAPSDVTSPDGTPTSVPTGTGYRAAVGFSLPIRWRHEYNDWVVVDAIGHKISGTKTSNASYPNWIPSVDCLPSGYATSISGPYTVGLSGITNSPATYNLSNTTTAITGSCTGLAHIGYSYKTSASGLPFDSVTYDTKLSNFSGIRSKFAGSINHGTFTVNETRLFQNKIPMESWLTFSFSCRTSGTVCNEFDTLSPTSTGATRISATCVGSYINADLACRDNIARPSGTYFTSEGVTSLKVVYSGVSTNIYPLVKVNSNTADLYTAQSGQIIYIDYNGAVTPEALRTWINEEFTFVQTSGVNNTITYRYPGVDLYWDTSASATPGEAWARIIPCDSAIAESNLPGIYVISIDGKFASDPTASDLIGQYGHDSTTQRYVHLTNGNGNYQMRFITDSWYLGKIEGGSFQSYYRMQYLTGGIPLDLLNNFNDYSSYTPPAEYTWNQLKIPVTCRSAPVGEWVSVDLVTYPGSAISVRDPIPSSYNEGNTCGI